MRTRKMNWQAYDELKLRLSCWAIVASVGLASGVSVASAPEQAGKAVTVSGQVYARNPEAGGKFRQLKVGDSIFKGEIINTGSDASVKLLMSDRSILDLGGGSLFTVDEYKVKGAANVKDRQVQFSMDYGKIRASVNEKLSGKGKFQIKTKSATMGVRGTEFVVLSDLAGLDLGAPSEGASGSEGAKSGNKTQIVVLEGKVEVAAPASKKEAGGESKPAQAPIALTAGQKLTAKSEEPADRGPAQEGGAKPAPAELKVETLTESEVKVAREEVKVEDKTFTNAIVVDRSNVGQESTATMSDVAQMFESELPAMETVEMQTDAFAGLPTYDPALIGSTVRLTVVFRK